MKSEAEASNEEFISGEATPLPLGLSYGDEIPEDDEDDIEGNNEFIMEDLNEEPEAVVEEPVSP